MAKVAFCTPYLTKPKKQYIEAMEKSIPLITSSGYEEIFIPEVGCPYISNARATMLRKALDEKADIIVFIDYDLSWDEKDLLNLVKKEGEVVAGLYRYKKDDEEYMGNIETDSNGYPIINEDGTLKGYRIPAGFMKITKEGVDRFMRAYPELIYGTRYNPSIDLFNHGVIDGVWYGEDMAFSKRWIEKCGELKIIPDMNLNHHSDEKSYNGNFHQYLMKQPGGINFKEN